MLEIFCRTNVTSNEEYKKYLKRRNYKLAGLFLMGVVTFAVSILAQCFWKVNIPEYILSTYIGLGVGLMVASIVLFIKNRKLLKNEERLRMARVELSDERNHQISTEATKIALMVLIVAMYFVMLIGGLWYPVLMKALCFLICLFVVAYCAAYKIVSTKI